MTDSVAVLGCGAWGLTLADYLSRRGKSVICWDRNEESVREMIQTGRKKRFPGEKLHEKLQFTSELNKAVSDGKYLVCAVPSHAIRELCESLKAILPAYTNKIFISTSKGIEQKTLLTPKGIFDDIFGCCHIEGIRFAVLAGPSHAEEVCKGVPTLVVSSATTPEDAEDVQQLFFSDVFRVYVQADVIGVELGGALKNVIAIAAGASDGLGFGDNTKAALLTRGVAEMTRLVVAMGGQGSTVAGLTGLGDLIVTGMSRHSRNRRFGELLSTGMSAEEAIKTIGAAVEGYFTTQSVKELSEFYNVELPIVDAVYDVAYGKIDVRQALESLLGRGAKTEIW